VVQQEHKDRKVVEDHKEPQVELAILGLQVLKDTRELKER